MNVLIGIGFLLMILGGGAADSPGSGYLYAGGIFIAGLALAALGQRLERSNKNERQ